MKASLLYRISSILLVLFAIGHTVGFSQIDPAWGVDSLVQSMKSIHFNVNGADRTYWDFFFGFGLFVTVFMLFASVVAWQLGSLSSETLATMRVWPNVSMANSKVMRRRESDTTHDNVSATGRNRSLAAPRMPQPGPAIARSILSACDEHYSNVESPVASSRDR